MTTSNKSKIIFITGATRGIGFAAAKMLASRGATVIIGSRDAAGAEAAAASIGTNVSALQVDINDDASVAAAARHIEEKYGRLDVLVNNAAVLLDGQIDMMHLKPDMLMQTLAVNVVAPLRVTQAMQKLLQAAEAGRIVNVSSGAGQLDGAPQAWAAAYCISKAAVNMFTQKLTASLPEIMTNSMCPGWCRTDMGGPEAPLTADDGADTLVWLALDAPLTLRGQFIKERKSIPW